METPKNTQRAAAVLVCRGPRVLAFERFDRPGYSLPCGHIHEGESAADAAVREALEETGYEVKLVGDEPFVGFDTVGNKLVTTFGAEIVGGDLREVAIGEGRPCWTSLRGLATGPYWHYNARALRYFRKAVPLAGKFHSHITVSNRSYDEAERAAKLTYGKLTVIDLRRDGRSQSDFMITHHYETGARGLEDQHDIEALLRSRGQLLQESGFDVLRLKLEYDLLHEHNDPRMVRTACAMGLYTEVHVRCEVREGDREALVERAAAHDWHPSRNPLSIRARGELVQFVNRRFYGPRELPQIDAYVDDIVPILSKVATVEEIKYEVAVYDTNETHDAWWMAPRAREHT